MQSLALACVGSLVISLVISLVPTHPAVVLGQDACSVEAEPNDAPEDGLVLSDSLCLTGELPDNDQDLTVWEVLPEDADQRWTFTVEGVPTTLTGLKIFPVTSEPGVEPIGVGSVLLDISVEPGKTTTTLEDVMLTPGRYVLGISRSSEQPDPPPHLAYRYRIEPGTPLPALIEAEPNDDLVAAGTVSDVFELTGDMGGSDDLFAWTVAAHDEQWSIAVTGPLGEFVRVELLDSDGVVLDGSAAPDSTALRDLELASGSYFIRLGRAPSDTLPYILSATVQDERFDPEPNDRSDVAVDIEDGGGRRGRLARTDGDSDRFRLRVPAGSSMLRDIRLLSRGTTERQLCLLDGQERDLVCRTGVSGMVISDLLLAPGEHLIDVRGRVGVDQEYLLRVDVTVAPEPDFEAEPNNEPAMASRLELELGTGGHSDRDDPDVFRATVAGEPQLWEFTAEAERIDQLSWIHADGSELAATRPALGSSQAVLTDVFLTPGNHHFRVRTLGGDYRLSAASLGPPDPDGEREPNSEPIRAEPYRLGLRRVGRLPTLEDADFYRFTLAAPEHLRLRLEQPTGLQTDLRLVTGGAELLRRESGARGETLDLDLWLRPGDYLLRLAPKAADRGRYVLTTERLDPFSLESDQEPNDEPGLAVPVPASLRWHGTGGASLKDWYTLPRLAKPAPIDFKIRATSGRVTLRLHAGAERIELVATENGWQTNGDAPAGIPLSLEIEAEDEYEIAISSAALEAAPVSSEPPLEVALDLAAEEIAAYWPLRQSVTGTLTVTNTGDRAAEIELEVATSHFGWSVDLPDGQLSIPAGSDVGVPISVDVAPDAWADEPVRISVRARTTDGGQVTTAEDLVASGEAPAIGAGGPWSVPEPLLGGLNVAAVSLGSAPAAVHDDRREGHLFDGVTPAGGGFALNVEAFPFDVTVDLAGENALPIVGTIINPLAMEGGLEEIPRRFELLLSEDGSTWTTVLQDELSPLPIDQAFTLEEPRTARHAMLRIHSTHGSRDGRFALGEWKVIAQPGAAPWTSAVDLADPALGGHVVASEPFEPSFPFGAGLLDDDPSRQMATIAEDDDVFDVVIGFQDGRAASIDGLAWSDPSDSDPLARMERVIVSISVAGPLGPWREVGSWDLVRDAAGAVGGLSFDEPVWARYVRLSGPLPEGVTQRLEMPADIDVFEISTDDDYHSILGEWGYTADVGPFEAALPISTSTAIEAAAATDAGDGPAEASPLAPSQTVSDRVSFAADVDWYRLDVPDGQNTLSIDVTGLPAAAVQLTLFDATTGAAAPMSFSIREDGVAAYEAAVRPGTRYHVQVTQPPFSAVFLFDTSFSMGPFLDFVREGIRSFAADVQPGREAVSLMGFEEAPVLPDWEDEPFLLIDAANNYVRTLESSNVEPSLVAAAELLAEREGARAILLVTDAETGSFQLAPQAWDAIRRVRPAIFSVHIGGLHDPAATRQRMQDWAGSSLGHYSYPTTHAEMDRAFDRMATWLRRPAAYSMSYSTSPRVLEPGSLTVRAADAEVTPGAAPDVGVEIILDTSGSMRDRLKGRRRIDIAKDALRQLVSEALVEGVPMAVRSFGGKGKGKAARCQTTLSLPLGPLERERALLQISKLKAKKGTRTPLGAALLAATEDLSDVRGPRTIVVVTDGKETCKGDPAGAIEALRSGGLDVHVNIVGFDLEDEALKETMAQWAAQGGGTYFDAVGPDALVEAITTAVNAPFRVYGPGDDPIDGGTLGGAAVDLSPGTYRVEVLVDPVVTFSDVVIGSGEDVGLVLPAPGKEP